MFQRADDEFLTDEGRRVTRRELLTMLAGAAVAGVSLSAQPSVSGRRLTHINLKVSNLKRSIAFYEKVFGPGRRNGPTYTAYDLGAGPSPAVPWISLQNDANVKEEGRLKYTPIWHTSLYTKPGTWEHIGIEVDKYDEVVAALKATGVEMTTEKDIVWTHDPDGALLQVQRASSWSGGASLSAEPPASSRRLHHINLKVSDLKRSIAFYEKVFGPGIRRGPTWTAYDLGAGRFKPVISLEDGANVKQEGILKYSPIWHTSLYTKSGTWEHVAIEVDNYDQVVAAVKATGVEVSVADGVVWTSDPDGALLQIMPSDLDPFKI